MNSLPRETSNLEKYTLFFLSIILIMGALVLIYPITLRLMLVFSSLYIIIFFLIGNRTLANFSITDGIFTLFILISTISSMFNKDLNSLISIISLALIYLVYTKVFNHKIFIGTTLKILTYSIIIAHIFILVWCVIENKYIYNAFSGIYNNPNAFGLIITLLTISLIALVMAIFDTVLQKKIVSKSLVLFLLVVLAYSFYLIVLSQSRTALLTNIIIAFLLFLVVVLRNIKSAASMLKIGLTAIAALLLLSVSFVFISPLREGINKTLLKFETKSLDVTDGRMDIWKKTLEDSTLFGYGHSYYGDGLGAHNTFVSILAEYGWISMVLFILFIAVCLIKAIRFAFVKEEVTIYYFIPLAVVLTFTIYSMMEILTFRPIMIALFIVCGMVTNYHKIARNRI